MSTEYTPARATDDESTSMVGAAREGYQSSRAAMESEDGRSIGQILGDVSRDVSTLMRQEVALAKAEARQSAAQAGKGIGMLVGAGVAGVLFLVFLSVCAVGSGSSSAGSSAAAGFVACVDRGGCLGHHRRHPAVGRSLGDEARPGPATNHRHPGQGAQRTERPRGGQPMSVSNDPDEIRADIERTRAELSDNVDALAETANPKNIARRQASRVKEAAVGVKEHIMGSPDDPYDSGRVGDAKYAVQEKAADAKYALQDKAADAKYALQDKASAVGDAVSNAPAQVKQKARGNPLAAGLIAFGAGLLISRPDSVV